MVSRTFTYYLATKQQIAQSDADAAVSGLSLFELPAAAVSGSHFLTSPHLMTIIEGILAFPATHDYY
jgi:hypothetical protein